MATFITFYSFKGGVGRSLALANVAWLLAHHESEPARVLVIDFDLGAPGLHRVFSMPHRTTALGLVDYVEHFIEKAELPSLQDYVHKTAFDLIDVIPAGKMDGAYQKRLDRINWKFMYEHAHGFRLFEELKRQISAAKPSYDYVLIDSLTGYSDIGGICVKQLPDSVILLFRLNQQNLDGIRTVYRSIRSNRTAPDEQVVPVVPVITPSWPFLDESSGKWIAKAQAVFPESRLMEISFDSGLSFGERIISESASKLALTSKVLVDYQALASTIRTQNAADPLTIWHSITSLSYPELGDGTADNLLRLLKMRPANINYWQFLPRVFWFANQRRKGQLGKGQLVTTGPYKKIKDFLNEQCAHGNKFALFGRALLAGIPVEGGVQTDGEADLRKALGVDPAFVEARLMLGQLAFARGEADFAISEYLTCSETLPPKDSRQAYIQGEIGTTYLSLLEAEKALPFLQRARRLELKDPELLLKLARTLYLVGQYEKALDVVKRYNSTGGVYEAARLLPAQILAAMGRLAEAKRELSALATYSKARYWKQNLAEAFLPVSPERTLQILSRMPSSDVGDERLVEILTLLAHVFDGTNLNDIQNQISTFEQRHSGPALIWDSYEMVAMVKAKVRNGALSSKAITLIEKAFDRLLYLKIRLRESATLP